MNLRDYYSNYIELSSNEDREFTYACISHETGKKCTYKVFLINKTTEKVGAGKLEEIEEILHEITDSPNLGPHHAKYVDYMIKTSKTKIKIEIVTEYNSKPLKELNYYELSIFFYNLRSHLKDILIAISYLKSRFIGDARWLKIKNLGFNPASNHIVLNNFVNINFQGLPTNNATQLPDIKEVANSNFHSEVENNKQEGIF